MYIHIYIQYISLSLKWGYTSRKPSTPRQKRLVWIFRCARLPNPRMDDGQSLVHQKGSSFAGYIWLWLLSIYSKQPRLRDLRWRRWMLGLSVENVGFAVNNWYCTLRIGTYHQVLSRQTFEFTSYIEMLKWILSIKLLNLSMNNRIQYHPSNWKASIENVTYPQETNARDVSGLEFGGMWHV